jgi:nucleoside-diphosphate-sugar epimerase
MSGLVLVTGATGFIGTYLVRQLVTAGQAVRVLARRPGALDPPLQERVESVAGDVRDPAAIERAVAGAHTVLHLAACARAWSRDLDEFESVNVRAVDTLLTAAARAGVERLVHVSTVLTLPPYHPAPVNGAASRPTPYEVTKRAGERLVESYAAQGHHATIVHPTRVYGPGPLTDANAVSRVVALYLSGRFRVRLDDHDALANYVHAADVATGIRLAADRGRTGAHYLLGGENVSFRAFLALVGELGGRRRRVMALPMPVALAAAHAAEWWGRLGGIAPLTPSWVRVFLEDRRGDIGPAQADLGYAPRPLRAGLTETIAWLAQRRRAAA